MTQREAYQRAVRLHAQHDAVCPAADACVKCTQLLADVAEARSTWLNSRFHWFTTGPVDTFRLAGNLVDSDRPWAMRDKAQHLFGGLLLSRLSMLMTRLMAPHATHLARARVTMLVVVGAALLNEGIEVFRMMRWWHQTSLFRAAGWEWHWDTWRWSHPDMNSNLTTAMPAAPPEWADSISWRDVVATFLGGLIGL